MIEHDAGRPHQRRATKLTERQQKSFKYMYNGGYAKEDICERFGLNAQEYIEVYQSLGLPPRGR
jgi:DNA-directed RNA polymerase specialized sigma24 family protein